jgi:beta-xylosidase
MSYKNTFIKISEDSNVSSATVPVQRNGKPTIASIEYDLIKNNPYEYTQEDVQFKTYLIKNQIDLDQSIDELREQFFTKPKACFRASPLVKKYGWGIHYDVDGKVAIYDAESDQYTQYLQLDNITNLKGMRSKRK